MDLLRAVRAVAAAKGFEDLVTKASALDEDNEISAAYQERLKLRSDSGLRAVSNAYAPPPIKAEQLQPSSAEVQRARNATESQKRSAERVMSGRPGITDR